MILRIVLVSLLASVSLAFQSQQNEAKERAAAVKQSLQQSQARLRKYEWIETTVVALKGEEKARKQNRCYYGTDGKLQKIPIASAQTEGAQPRGRLRGRIIERKKEELTDYMQQAIQLVHQYIPPDPARIQAAVDSSRINFQMTPPGVRGLLTVRDYLQGGDTLSLEVDLQTNSLVGLRIRSFLNKPDDSVDLDARLSKLEDGTDYPSLITLDAKAKGVRVTVQNSGYHSLGR